MTKVRKSTGVGAARVHRATVCNEVDFRLLFRVNVLRLLDDESDRLQVIADAITYGGVTQRADRIESDQS